MMNDASIRGREVAASQFSEREALFLKNVNDAVISTNLDDRILSWNPAAAKLYGWQADEVIGKHLFDVVPTDYEDQSRESILARLEVDGHWSGQLTQYARDGRRLTVTSSVTSLRLADAGLSGSVVINRDITELVESRNVLYEREQRYRTLVDSLPSGIYETDAEGHCVYVNPTWCQHAGLSPEQAMGDGWRQGLHPDDRERISKLWAKHALSREPWSMEYRFQTPAGETTWVHGTAIALYNSEHELTGYLGVNTDITDRKKAEVALSESEKQHRLLFDQAGLGIGYYDADLRIVSYNETAARNLGLSQKDVEGKMLAELFGNEAAGVYEERLRQAMASESKLTFEDCIDLPQGDIWFQSTYSALRDQDGKPLGVQIVSANISALKIAESELQQSKRLLVSAQKIAGVGHWSWNVETNEAMWSDELYRIYGRDPSEGPAPIETWTNNIHPDDREPLLAHLNDVIEGRVDRYETTYRLRRYDTGEYCWMHVQGEMIPDSDGRRSVLVGVGQDITEQIEASKALEESERKFASAFNDSPIPLSILDFDNDRRVAVNARFVEAFGYSRNELMESSFKENNLAANDAELEEAVELVKSQGELTDYPFHMVRKDGAVRNLLCSAARISSEDRHQYIITYVDVTDRKAAEDRVRFQANLLEAVEQAVIVTKPDGKIIYWNPFAEKLYGWASDEALGMNIIDVTVPQISKAQGEQIMEQLSAGNSWSGEFDVQHRDGTVFPSLVNDTPIYDPEGNLTAIIGVSVDLTERKRMETLLRQTQKLQSIGTLASGVAHEINNPLMGMLNYTELVKDRVEDPKLTGYLAEIGREGKRIATIVSNLLSFAAPRMDELKKANIRDIVERSLSLVGSQIRKHQITVQLDLPEHLPDVVCRPAQIEQVIINLLTNAVDALNDRYAEYHDEKQAIIAATVFDHKLEKKVSISVEDRGLGIPDSAVEQIFDPFFSTKGRLHGTGLGLSISYGIVKEHGSELIVESVQGEYSRFSFDLPVADRTEGN